MRRIRGELLNLSGHGAKTMKVMCPMDHNHIPVRECDEAWCTANRGTNKDVDDRQQITFFEVKCGYDDLLKKLDAQTAEKAKARIRAAQQ